MKHSNRIMEKSSICRICLAVDVRMHLIKNTQLREMYETLSKTPWETQDKRPTQACYICFARLKNCYKLKETCIESEKQLTEMLSNASNPAKVLEASSRQKFSIAHSVINITIGNMVARNTVHIVPKQGGKGIYYDVEINQVYAKGAESVAPASAPSGCSTGTIDTDPLEESVSDPEEDVPSSNKEYEMLLQVVKVESVLPQPGNNNELQEDTVMKQDTSLSDVEDDMPLAKINRDPSDSDTSAPVPETPTTNSQSNEVDSPVSQQKKIELPSSTENNTSLTRITPYQCNVCSQCYSHKFHLIAHIRSAHHGEKPYKCKKCPESFAEQSDLDLHFSNHDDEKQYQCIKCDKTFFTRNGLETHMSGLHGTVKPYQCNVCNRLFNYKASYNSHMRTHTGEKPFQCGVCNKAFSQSVTLRKHFSIHTGEKPYKCNICNRTFARKCYLNVHIPTHRTDKPYECEKCKKTFKHKASFNSHTRWCVQPYRYIHT